MPGAPENLMRLNKCFRKPLQILDQPLCAESGLGLEYKIKSLISPPKYRKKVAVIGGGLAGTETGMHLEEKGHSVRVLEKSDFLARKEIWVLFSQMRKKPTNPK